MKLNLEKYSHEELKILLDVIELKEEKVADELELYIREKHNTLPRYVKCDNTCLRLKEVNNQKYYYKDAGAWQCDYKFVKGILYSDADFIKPDKKLIFINYAEWKQDNSGYV